MNHYYTHEVGLCTYIENFKILPFKRWLGWLRKRGIGCIYIYTSEDTSALRDALKREIFSGQVVVFSIKVNEGVSPVEEVYNDCLNRVRYICRYLAILKPEEYIEGLVGGSFEELARSVFAPAVSWVEFPCSEDEVRYLINPLLVREFKNRHLLSASGYHGRTANGLSIGKKKVKNIALLSHVMARNGAPLALLEVAKILKEAGYEIDAYSITPGPLEEEFGKLGISVTVDPFLHGRPLAEQPWYHAYDLFFVNTAVMANCFTQPLDDTTAIWWLHESASILNWCNIDEKSLALLKPQGVTTLGVSEVAIHDFHALAPKFPINATLTLGVEDIFKGRKRQIEENPYIFMMCGTVESRKGQDIFLKAVTMMPEAKRKKCHFYMIGTAGQSTDKDYIDNFNNITASVPEVKIISSLPKERMLDLYGEVDAFVVPSREECLPTVAMEAMMMGVPCILSDTTGVSYMVEDKVSALIFPVGNAESLSLAMSYFMEDWDRAQKIGLAGRKVYEKNFHNDIFSKNLLSWVERAIEEKRQ